MESSTLLNDLNGRLGFIGRFYLKAVRPFETTQRKIVREKEAYLSRGSDSPGFIEEDWNEATKCVQVLGQCCLGLLEKVLHDYLRKFTDRQGGVVEKKSGNWFKRYCDFLTQRTSFEWARSPVSHNQIEQINLSRNDCAHALDIDGEQPAQSQEHFKKHPRSRFSDELERAIRTAMDGREPDFPISLSVTKHELFSALADVKRFCEFVETQKGLKP
jgi:hypothetical protein